jgi:threonine aldolase
VGSIVVGSKDFIWRARRGRKLVGGGLRQVGILAAAGLVALSDGPDGMIERLADDHANAHRLAEGLAELDGIVSAGGIAQPTPGRLDPTRVRTNFVLFKVRGDRSAFLERLKARGILMVEYPHGAIRAATHHDVSAEDVTTIIHATRDVLHEMAGRTGLPVGA